MEEQKEEIRNIKREKNNNGSSVILILSILISFICGTIGAFIMIKAFPNATNNIVKSVSNVNVTENSIADAVSKAYDAVVVVVAYQNGVQASSGTGFVYKNEKGNGYILTNNHVVSGGDKIEVIFSNGNSVEATIAGSETYSDIAVLKVPSEKVISTITIGNSTDMRLGDTVFTIGSPMGQEYSGTVTKGILSGKDRLVEVSFSGNSSDYYMKVLQTDAAINPGNSGGPLLNINGEVIGINSLKLVENEIEGMGFAIPIEDAIYYASILENGGTVKRPYLGVSMLDVTDTYYLWQNGITIPKEINSGVVVLATEAGSPAANGGMKKGDIITKIGDKDVKTVADLRYELYKHEPKEKIEVTYIRDGKTEKAKITLGEK